MRLKMERGGRNDEWNGVNGENSDSEEEEGEKPKKNTGTFKARPKSAIWSLPMHQRNTVRHTVTLKGMRFCSKNERDGDGLIREVKY